jgi:aminoglycoside/choline kinase family phosphotransferase
MNKLRESLRENFIKVNGWTDASCFFLAGDCSNRHYYRLNKPDGTTAVLMDAYGDNEHIAPFIKIAELLGSLGCSAPKVLGYDMPQRFILLEDLGDATFTYCLKQGMDPTPLYETAVDALIQIHQNFDVSLCPDLPAYGTEEMLTKNNQFLDWYYPRIHGTDVTQPIKDAWTDSWHEAFKILNNARKTLILRDFHVDNLLWLKDRKDHQRCGLLDFQDAALGGQSYDLVSLFEDVRQDVDQVMAKKLIQKYLSHFSYLDEEAFMAQYYTLGAQRITRIIGVFSRMLIQDKRPHYMAFLPRAWKWLENDLKHDNLLDIRRWFDTHIPPEKRGILHDN